MTTKDQERKALAKIKAIVEGLGENSYIGTALAGCFEKAEENIEYDAAFSLLAELEAAEEEKISLNSQLIGANTIIDALKAEKQRLEEELDRLAEWEPTKDCGTQMSEKDYQQLKNTGCSNELTDDEAKTLVEEEFGFAPRHVEIIRTVKTYKKSERLGRYEVDEEFERVPLNCSTDWNYIRFNCAGWCYEMIDGQLYQYCC